MLVLKDVLNPLNYIKMAVIFMNVEFQRGNMTRYVNLVVVSKQMVSNTMRIMKDEDNMRITKECDVDGGKKWHPRTEP